MLRSDASHCRFAGAWGCPVRFIGQVSGDAQVAVASSRELLIGDHSQAGEECDHFGVVDREPVQVLLVRSPHCAIGSYGGLNGTTVAGTLSLDYTVRG
jgi:hypothetical protein